MLYFQYRNDQIFTCMIGGINLVKEKMRISDVYKLYQELRSVGVPEVRYLIMKDGQQIGGSPVLGFNGFYCLENSADLWFVYYQNQSGQREMHLKCEYVAPK